MPQWFLRISEFPEFTEFNESFAPFRENSTRNNHLAFSGMGWLIPIWSRPPSPWAITLGLGCLDLDLGLSQPRSLTRWLFLKQKAMTSQSLCNLCRKQEELTDSCPRECCSSREWTLSYPDWSVNWENLVKKGILIEFDQTNFSFFSNLKFLLATLQHAFEKNFHEQDSSQFTFNMMMLLLSSRSGMTLFGCFSEEGTDPADNDKTQIVRLSQLYDSFVIREADTNIDSTRNFGTGYSYHIYTLVANFQICFETITGPGFAELDEISAKASFQEQLREEISQNDAGWESVESLFLYQFGTRSISPGRYSVVFRSEGSCLLIAELRSKITLQGRIQNFS